MILIFALEFEDQSDGFKEILAARFTSPALTIRTRDFRARSNVPLTIALDDRREFFAHVSTAMCSVCLDVLTEGRRRWHRQTVFAHPVEMKFDRFTHVG